MSMQYSITVQNDSHNSGSICVYQTVPNQDQNFYSLAWFCKTCHPSTRVRFNWNMDYSFCWAESGVLSPGVIFDATEMKEADPTNPGRNAIGFSKKDGAYLFTPSQRHPSEGNLGIYLDGSIVHGEAAVGVGLGGHAAFAALATPNYNMTFSPRPQYWVVFGTFQEGEVIDLDVRNKGFTQQCNVNFPTNVYSMTITLREDNTWG